eukprot:GHVN01009729.1.p1 GENE.GHVN01009729.1~~GHVN01009729.1.p1  ORF type:complete len:786 (+),score=62.78 GHVN01009729.1:2056-4413(+)
MKHGTEAILHIEEYVNVRRIKKKNFFVFSNEYSAQIYREKDENESINDRNDSIIRKSTQWYSEHYGTDKGTRFILVTNDKENTARAVLENIHCIDFDKYVQTAGLAPEIVSLVSTEDEPISFSFEEHLRCDEAKRLTKVQPEKYIEGILKIKRNSSSYGTIKQGDLEIHINGKAEMNRGINGDLVVAAVIDTESGEKQGRIISILRRVPASLCCFFDQKEAGVSGRMWLLATPKKNKYPRIRVKAAAASSLIGKIFVVTIDEWKQTSRYPEGHISQIFGDLSNKESEMDAILFDNNINCAPFPPIVTACLPEEQWIVSEDELKGRIDLRGETIFSIDPPGCTDIDDALHARRLENGNYIVGVHIADVTHFVREHTALDKEAERRGTTVYLSGKRIDMLPALLGTNLCSLREKEDRLAFSCIWEMKQDGEIVSTYFTKSIIRSCASFSYEEAQNRLENTKKSSPQNKIDESLLILSSLSSQLRNRRKENGALFLSSFETCFSLDPKTKDPLECFVKEQGATNHLIEEFMLCANISVARKIHEAFPLHSLLRKHDRPDPARFNDLNTALQKKGLSIDTRSAKTIANSLEYIEAHCDKLFARIVNIAATRAMMRAKYFVSGGFSYDEFAHTGIASDIYTHFTSPIRRYPDVIVHRLLLAAITDKRLPETIPSQDRYEALCEHLNDKKDAAVEASRASCQLYAALFFKEKTLVEPGYVIRLIDCGFIVVIPKYGLEGLVYDTSYKLDMERGAVLDADRRDIASVLKIVQIQITVQESIGQKTLDFKLLA